MKISQSDVIKIAVVATAGPRWIGAMLVTERAPIPETWLDAWRWLVVFLTMGMAIAEAFGISYMLHASRVQGDKKSKWITPIVLLNFVVFAMIVAPYVYSNMRGISVSEALPGEIMAWIWAVAVPLSTGAIVAGVGFADRSKDTVNTVKESVKIDSGKKMSSEEIIVYILTLYTEKPGVSVSEAAREVGITRPTAYKYLNQLVEEGKMTKNGHGYEVIAAVSP